MSIEELDSLIYRVKVEDRHLEPVGNYDVFNTRPAAMGAFYEYIAARDLDIGSVYVTAADGDDEWVIATHSFI